MAASESHDDKTQSFVALTSGTLVYNYRILEKIGSGGMGEVFRARDTRLDRIVAIKVLPSHSAMNADMKARFEREAKTISGLNHPNVCTLFDVGHETGVDFLVMEFLEGEPLNERLKRGKFETAEALEIGAYIRSKRSQIGDTTTSAIDLTALSGTFPRQSMSPTQTPRRSRLPKGNANRIFSLDLDQRWGAEQSNGRASAALSFTASYTADLSAPRHYAGQYTHC